MVHVKEGQDSYGISRSEEIVGAILDRHNNPWDVDTWRLCYDLDEMLRRDGREVIYAGTEAEIESEVWKRYPVEGSGVALVTRTSLGWEIERTPRLMQADLNLLQEACAIHKGVLVGNDLVDLLGGRERLAGLGFLLAERRSRWGQLARHNPRQVAVNRWKQEVQDLGRYFQPEFPAELVGELFDAVRPEHWHEEHPYQGLLKTDCQVIGVEAGRRHSWGRQHHRRYPPERTNLAGAPGMIFAFVEIARKLSRGEHTRPWRRTGQWRELLEGLIEYIHGVEAGGDKDWRKLARWVRAEARVAGVKVPLRKKLPPRPAFGKKAARRQARRECVPT